MILTERSSTCFSQMSKQQQEIDAADDFSQRHNVNAGVTSGPKNVEQQAGMRSPPENFQRRRRCCGSESKFCPHGSEWKPDTSDIQNKSAQYSRQLYNCIVGQEIAAEMSSSHSGPCTDSVIDFTILVLSHDPTDCGSDNTTYTDKHDIFR